jgi:hypothetical protein
MIRIIFCLLLVWQIHSLQAKEVVDSNEYTRTQMVVSSTNNLEKESSYYSQIQSTLSNPLARTFIINKSVGIVQLYYPLTSTPVPHSGSAEVKLDITYTVEDKNALVERHMVSTLAINMGRVDYKPLAFIKLDNAIKISARIIEEPSIPSEFNDIKLQLRIETEVFDKMLYTDKVTGISSSDLLLASEGNLVVSWDPFEKAESYELEWTYVSNQSPDNPNQTVDSSKIVLRDGLFRGNSSRVEIKENYFKIPMIYEKGLIFYRVRPLGKNIADGEVVVIKGTWSLEHNSTSVAGISPEHFYTFEGLEEKLNWQSSLSFAEEGKNKVVISYHDGSARNRQALTRINTDERVIVGETFYDYNGRPVIQVLPVPEKGANYLSYHPRFNRFESVSGAPIDITKNAYDIATEGNGCEIKVPGMDVHYGASRYYSPENNFEINGNKGINIINKELIPDAKKYPYTQTRYTNDNTGRIRAQSGVGDAHLLNSSHETRYFYGTPDQEELVRLFGTRVGNNGHYKKNVVIDPNGQVSVSYLDMDGKVIATALAGDSPDNVSALTGEKNRTIKTQVLNAVTNILSEDRLSKNYLKKLVVTNDGTTYDFYYKFTAQPYTIQCVSKSGNNQNMVNLNLSAVLDAEIELTGCGNSLFKAVLPGSYQFGNGSVQTKDEKISKTLNAGEYTLTKNIRINESKLNDYLDQYLSNDSYTCVISVGDYIKDSIDIVDLSGCGYSCETCRTNVEATILRLSEKYTLTEGEKETMRSKCYDLCRSNITCASALNGMLGDVSIGGQYGEIMDKNLKNPQIPAIDANDFNNQDVANNPKFDVSLGTDPDGSIMGTPIRQVNPSKFKLSVYNTENILPVPSSIRNGKVDFHNPLRIKITGDEGSQQLNSYNLCLFKENVNFKVAEYIPTDYYGTDGKKVYAKIRKSGDNSYVPEIISEGYPHVIVVNEEIGEYKVPIKYIKDVAVFRDYWQPHFANYLVMYHPEFMYFVECNAQYDENEFEYKLVTAETPSDDTDHLFTDGNGNVTILENDPLLLNNPNIAKTFKLKFNNYKFLNGNTPLTMVQVANLGSGCPDSSIACPGSNCPATTLSLSNNTAWSLFKSLYITERQNIIRMLETRKAIEGGYYNGCIGDKNFYQTDEASLFFQQYKNQTEKEVFVKECEGMLWWKKCKEVKHIYTENTYYLPYLDPFQVCYAWRANFFEDKTRLFYPKTYSVVGDLQQGRCTRQLLDEDGNPVQIVINCPEDEEDYIQQVNSAVARKKYEECGLCPLASDVQDFLVQTQRKKLLNSSTPVILSCPPGEAALIMGGALTQEFKSGGTVQEVNWSGTYNATTRTFTGRWLSDLKTITIDLDFNSFPQEIGVDFNKLKICCLKPVDATHFKLNVYYSGYYHKITKELIEDLSGVSAAQEANYQKAEFEITGTINGIDLTTCTMAPNCAVTSVARHITGFLNALNYEIVDKKAKLLVTAGENYIDLDPNHYEVALRNLLNINAVDENGDLKITYQDINPKWKASVNAVTGKLLGKLIFTDKATNDTVCVDIIIKQPEGTPVLVNFTDVKYFTNLKAISDISGCQDNRCGINKFMADAVTFDASNNKIYTRVEICVPNKTMTICEKAVLGSN